MKTIQTKTELRKEAKLIRKQFSSTNLNAQKSSVIVSKILNSIEFKKAKHIGIYYPINGEIDLLGLLNVKDKNFYFPRCIENELYFSKFSSKDDLVDGCFGEKIPQTNPINPEILDVIYVPALIANSSCYRLGYGCGFYDRFFKTNAKKAHKCIVIANELINDNFKEDLFDYQCDSIISA